MSSTEQITTPEIKEYLTRFDDLGGVIDFKFFNISNASSDLDRHLQVANRTLELLGQDNDHCFNKVAQQLGTSRDAYFKVVSKPILPNKVTPLTPEDFFGPYFNFKEQRPILLETKGKPFQNVTVFNDYYYYDDTETPDNIVSVKQNNNSDFVTQAYTDAFLKPPYPFGKIGMTNFDKGKLFLEFNQFLFDDITKITVYSWQTDCSNYFDDGKEWWGSFFWTVYNPAKKWHIGIAASTTD